jgi:hypothetical protein
MNHLNTVRAEPVEACALPRSILRQAQDERSTKFGLE